MMLRYGLFLVAAFSRNVAASDTTLAKSKPDGRGHRTLQNGFFSQSTPSTGGTWKATSFIDEDELSVCRSRMLQADSNGDSKLSSDEFAEFIALTSGNYIDLPFRDQSAVFVMLFYSTACSTCVTNGLGDQCCIGNRAHIPLPHGNDDDLQFLLILDYVCPNVDNALRSMLPSGHPAFPGVDQPSAAPSSMPLKEPSPFPTASPTIEPSLAPTPLFSMQPSHAPTVAPTKEPTTKEPTNLPTSAPSPAPSNKPTDSPTSVPTRTPTVSPTLTPTRLPSSRPVATTPSPMDSLPPPPTASPTGAPTERPSPQPTSANPTASPTMAPSLQPTMRPSLQPTASPTIAASNAPSVSPTAPPSVTISAAPTVFPTLSPTVLPTLSPTAAPTTTTPTLVPTTTAEPDLLCVTFAYTLENTGGNTADDILMGTNTILEDLLFATRNVTISILNQTTTIGRELRTRPPGLVQESLETVDQFGDRNDKQPTGPSVVAVSSALHAQDRRLVFYSDDFPPEIPNIVDSPFCFGIDTCVVVSTVVCVVLEEGDDPVAIRAKLIDGFRDSIDSGRFNEVLLPP